MPTVRRHKRSRTVRHKYDYDRMTKNLVIFIIWLAVLLIPVTHYGARYFIGLSSADAIDMAQIAKQEALGRGFVSGYAMPALMQMTKKVVYPPEIVRPPLYIWVLSFFPGVAEGKDGSVSLCSSVFFVLTGVLIFQFARLYSGFSKAVVASIIYLLSITLLKAAISGMSYTLTGFLFTFLCFLTYLDNGKSFLLSFVMGIVTGACYLSDYHFLPVVLPVSIIILYGHAHDRWRFLALFLIGFAAITLPWLLRNYGLGINPFIGFPLKYRMIIGAPATLGKLTFGRFGLTRFDELYSYAVVYRRFVLNLIMIYKRFISFGGILIMVAFIGSVFVPYNGLGAVRAIVYSSVVLIICTICMDDIKIVGLTPLIPMIIFLAVLGAYKIIDNMSNFSNNVKLWAIRGFIALNVLPFISAIVFAPNLVYARRSMERSRLVMEEMGSIVGSREVVLSNQPWKLAWHSGIPSVLLPEEGDYDILVQSAGDFKFAYLTAKIRRENMKLWSPIYTSRSVPSWFPLKYGHVFSDKSLLLSDKKRW